VLRRDRSGTDVPGRERVLGARDPGRHHSRGGGRLRAPAHQTHACRPP
jgi:hypothetical protein